MKTLLFILFPIIIYSQQLKDTVNFHLLSEFVVNKEIKITPKIKNLNKIINKRVILLKGDTLSRYKVTKIDSLGNYYLIEAKNAKYIYKIASMKLSTFDRSLKVKDTIKVGQIYQLDLRSFNNNNLRIHIDPSRVGFPLAMSSGFLDVNDIEYYDLYGEYRIKYGLYSKALNLRGLYIIDGY